MKKTWLASNILLLLAFGLSPSIGRACTVGVVGGGATTDGRPIMFKNRDNRPMEQQRLSYYPASKSGELAYIGVHTVSGGAVMGLNEAGLASGNSSADDKDTRYIRNAAFGRKILSGCKDINEAHAFIDYHINLPSGHRDTHWVSGCFPFIDAEGKAIMYEVSKSQDPDIGIWYHVHNSMDEVRKEQNLFGIVPRANRFHRLDNGKDRNYSDHYRTARDNMQGLRDLGILNVRTLLQGSPDKQFEVLRNSRTGKSRDIARWWTLSTIVVHGVKPGEDPDLTTMWTLLGKPDYCVAVPAWVRVSNIPDPLKNGLIWDHTESLYKKGQREITHASTFPAETHIFEMVDTVLLPHWREHGVPSVQEMTRVQHQIANDAYSLLKCLDRTRADNKAPVISPVEAVPESGRSFSFSAPAHDPDGTIESTVWDFGDGRSSTDITPKHTYQKAGNYLVSCTVRDNEFVTMTSWKYVTAP